MKQILSLSQSLQPVGRTSLAILIGAMMTGAAWFGSVAFAQDHSPEGRPGGFSGGFQGRGQGGPQPGLHGGPGGGGLPPMIRNLGLTDEQMTKLKTTQQESMAEARKIQQQARERRKALMEYIASPEAKEEKASVMQRELNENLEALAQLRLRSWFKMRSILTPEQLQKLVSERKQRMQQMRPGQQQSGGGQMGGPGSRRFGPGGLNPQGFGQGGFGQRRGPGGSGQWRQGPGRGNGNQGQWGPPPDDFEHPPEGPPPEQEGWMPDGMPPERPHAYPTAELPEDERPY